MHVQTTSTVNEMKARFAPYCLLAVWIVAVGLFMWTRAHQSLTAPGPDPLSYMQKAKNTWENARQGFPVNPLNVEQPLRPPGTTLISFPSVTTATTGPSISARCSFPTSYGR